MAACPWACNACASKNHPVPKSSSVSILPATTPSWPLSPITTPNPSSFLPIAQNEKSPVLKTARQILQKTLPKPNLKLKSPHQLRHQAEK
jgi:hypothetical protein